MGFDCQLQGYEQCSRLVASTSSHRGHAGPPYSVLPFLSGLHFFSYLHISQQCSAILIWSRCILGRPYCSAGEELGHVEGVAIVITEAVSRQNEPAGDQHATPNDPCYLMACVGPKDYKM
jgi:hypothetical protein